jgi:hypothetical protein
LQTHMLFYLRLNQLKKSKRVCKQAHKNSAHFGRHNFCRKEAQQVTAPTQKAGFRASMTNLWLKKVNSPNQHHSHHHSSLINPPPQTWAGRQWSVVYVCRCSNNPTLLNPFVPQPTWQSQWLPVLQNRCKLL